MLRHTHIQIVGVTRVIGAVTAQQQVNVEGFHANGVCEGFDKLSPNGVGRIPNGVGLIPNGVGRIPNGLGRIPNGLGLSPNGALLTAAAPF